jgi:RNA polymerase sigma-70 factor (ECF subfamily)
MDPSAPAPGTAAALPGAELTDEEVARRVLGGDPALFELLMRRHNRLLFRVARAVVLDEAEAEDVVQEAWVRGWRHLDQFDGRSRLATWLSRIALHEALARKRRASRFASLPAPDDHDGPGADRFVATGPDPEHLAAGGELGRLLAEELARLPESARAVFVLRSVEELSTAETAAVLGIDEGAVKVRLHRARGRLRAALDARFERATRELWDFLGARCDRVVAAVLARIAAGGA